MTLEHAKCRSHIGARRLMAILCWTFVLLSLLLLAVGDESRAEAAKVIANPTELAPLAPMDFIDIYQLYSAYSLALDTGNGPGVVATFAPDGTFGSSRSNHQPVSMETVLKWTNGYARTIRPSTRYHILTNIHITPTADGANATCYAILAGLDSETGTFALTAGFYTTTLVKTADGWRFKHLEFWSEQEEIEKYHGM
jgi:hypothetical protein